MQSSEFSIPQNELLRGLQSKKVRLASEGRDLIDLSMINPDLVPPRVLIDRLIEATMKPQNHRYAVARGIRKLREAFAVKYASYFEVPVDADKEVCVTMGTKDALFNLLRCLTQPGGRVIVGTPTYPMHAAAAKLAHLECITFTISTDYEAMLREIDSQAGTTGARVVLLNFPNNPTGITVNRDFYLRLGTIAEKRGLFVINDFVYGEMGFGESAASMLRGGAARNWGAEIYSLSKAYNVPGWRIGACVGNSSIIARLAELKSLVDYGIFLPLQLAAAAALSTKEDLTAATVTTYRGRLTTLQRGLSKLGWETSMPQAGCCLWARVPASSRSLGATAYCEQLLDKQGIALTPGLLFGAEYEEWIRFAAVTPEERIREAIDRLYE
jgi:alanine-synthesizing transaminase